MTAGEAEALFRSNVKDTVKPYLFGSTDFMNWLNEAEEEACARADLLHDSSTTAICSIAVTAATASYSLDSRVLRVTRATFTPAASEDDDDPDPIALELFTDTIEPDRRSSTWRTDSEVPSGLIVLDGSVRFTCLPDTAGTLALEVYRLPLERMESDGDEPEIAARHHRKLVHWCEHRAYSVPDAETRDPQRAAAAEAEFERYFGARPDADAKQAFEARPQFNKAVW